MSVHDCFCFCGFILLVFGGIAGLIILLKGDREMTNAEKFKEVFGYKPNVDSCVAPYKVCIEHETCDNCPFSDWWSKEYKPCFVLAKEYE